MQPDKHANADDQTKEEFSAKFKQAKEAYETLSDIDRRKAYDEGVVKPPPGGWYQEIDKRVFQNIQRNDGAVRGGLGAPYINIRGVAVVPVVRGPSRVLTGRGRVTRAAPPPYLIPRFRGVRAGFTLRGVARGGRDATLFPSRPNNIGPVNLGVRPRGRPGKVV